MIFSSDRFCYLKARNEAEKVWIYMGKSTPVKTFILSRTHFIFIAEISGIIAATLSVISILLNTILFSFWGISFITVATAADIFSSGFLIIFSVLVAVAPAMIYLMVIFVYKRCHSYIVYLHIDSKLSEYLIYAIVILIAYNVYRNLYYVLIDLLLIFVVELTVHRHRFTGRFIVGLIVFVKMGLIVYASIEMYSVSLLNSDKYVLNSHSIECPLMKVVWNGSSSIIVECNDKRDFEVISTAGIQIGTKKLTEARIARLLYRPMSGPELTKWTIAPDDRADLIPESYGYYYDRSSIAERIEGLKQVIVLWALQYSLESGLKYIQYDVAVDCSSQESFLIKRRPYLYGFSMLMEPNEDIPVSREKEESHVGRVAIISVCEYPDENEKTMLGKDIDSEIIKNTDWNTEIRRIREFKKHESPVN